MHVRILALVGCLALTGCMTTTDPGESNTQPLATSPDPVCTETTAFTAAGVSSHVSHLISPATAAAQVSGVDTGAVCTVIDAGSCAAALVGGPAGPAISLVLGGVSCVINASCNTNYNDPSSVVALIAGCGANINPGSTCVSAVTSLLNQIQQQQQSCPVPPAPNRSACEQAINSVPPGTTWRRSLCKIYVQIYTDDGSDPRNNDGCCDLLPNDH